MKDDARERVVRIEVVDGPAGPSLGIMDGSTGQRIAGPKPWAGGDVVHSFEVPVSRILAALRGSEGREVVGKGWVSEQFSSLQAERLGEEGRGLFTVYRDPPSFGDAIPVAIIRRQEAESDTDTGEEG